MVTQPKGETNQVDELRQHLRSLGYLDAGFDRYVLAPARDTRRPFTIAALTSLRIGVLAAVLLGPASAIGLSAGLPGFITGPRDAFVVALYLGVLFGGAVFVAALLASAGVAWLAKRAGAALSQGARAWSLAAGGGVTILCLVYLTLWWQAARVGADGTADSVALVLAYSAAVSLLLGHAVTVATAGLIVARTGADPQAHGVPASSWRATLATGVLAFAGAFLLFTYTTATEPVGGSQPLTVVSGGLRLRMLAIDGFDPGLFQELSAAGRVPALAGVLGSTHARVSFDEHESGGDDGAERDPARTWTTVATGQPAALHGVRALETRRVAGLQGNVSTSEGSPLGRTVRAATELLRLSRPALTSGTDRQEKTFWEVAADAGLRVAVVNWWATWPATIENGIVLSDRATLRLERGGALDAEITPAEAYDRLRDRWPAIRDRARARMSEVLDVSTFDADTEGVLRRSAELDALQLDLAAQVSSKDTDLVAVYLPGLDIAQHALLGPEATAGRSASAVAARVAALREYYVALDRLLATALRPTTGELVMVVTAPGRVTAEADGRIAVSGSIVKTAVTASGTSRDIAPTVLYALGVPISDELAGAPIRGLFDNQFASRYPVRRVPTYGRPTARRSVREGQPLDQEMIDRLRSLGYVR